MSENLDIVRSIYVVIILAEYFLDHDQALKSVGLEDEVRGSRGRGGP